MQWNRKVLALFIISIIAFIAILISNSTSARAEAGPVEIGYLMDEDFSFLYDREPGEVRVSGWDVQSAGGSISYAYLTWFKISDTNATLPVSMNKKFVTQSVGVITLEYRFKFASIMDGMKWALRSNEVEGVSIVSRNDTLYLEAAGNNAMALQTYAAGVEYGVKVVADVSGNKTDVYINGILKASAAGFKQPVTNLNNLQMNTGGAAVGDIYISPIKIYKGYVVNEKFISTMPGYLPGDWMANNVGGVIAVVEMRSTSFPDVHSLKMDATNATNSMSMEKSFTPQADNLIFEYKILIPQKTDGLAVELKSGNISAIKLTTSNGKLSYINGAGLPVEVYDYKTNLWYHMKVKMNRITSKADIYINGKIQKQGADFASSVANIDRIKFSTSAVNKGVMWLDDIKLNRDLPLPADYVPAPIQVSKASPDQPLVGVQTCNMWREGHHLGWDLINPYPERTPYLGFYDEGSAETTDWEMKWMVEHGIDFQLSCWFRPQGSEGLPIKDPYLSFALHDGFFNAQYSNQMKFAIMWENGASRAKDSNDFRNNIVPFWLEYYFKDPRYLKIDNKPVISIYSLTGLKRDFGGTLAGVKAEIDYLRSAVQSAGFADIIVLSSYSGTDAQVMSDEKTAGVNAIYAYTWGALSGHTELQKSYLTRERDTGAIDVVPTLSMGRDDSAWGLSAGYYATPSEFQSVAQWAKDTFIPSLPLNSLGKKMILLDNWNEFGEGHYIMPAGLDGFGYVDAIRNVFTSGVYHVDAQPTDVQKNRINTLYPSGRVLPNKSIIPPTITNNYKKMWEFNNNGNSEGWSLIYQIDNLIVQDGTYSGTSNNTDPAIISADQLGINVDDVPYLKIRMKNSTKDVVGKIYFITDIDGVWNEAKSIVFYVNPVDSVYTDYYVSMWQNKNWIGTVRQLRFDPIGAVGNFSIDYIRMVYSMLFNAGFEAPVTSTYLYGPMSNGWTFDIKSGVQKNGSAFGAAIAPEGVQTAFISNAGTISQTVTFPAAGSYKVSFQAAKRTTWGGTESFDVYYDTTVIGSFTPSSGSFTSFTTRSFTATAGNHTIKFVGTNTVGDNTDFLDAITIQATGDIPALKGLTATAGKAQISLSWTALSGATSYNIRRSTTSGGPYTTIATGVTLTAYTDTGLMNGTTYYYVVSATNSSGTIGNSSQVSAIPNLIAIIILNAGFEAPSTSTYLYGPMTNGWTFDIKSGVQKNGSAFGAATAPEGVQTAFISNAGTISQTVTFPAAGSYTVSFQAAKRTTWGGTESFDVYYDTTVIGSFTPSSGSFTSFTTRSFTATKGSHMIKFVGTNTVGDNTDFLDAITIN
mgnify:CR=1 FL=1